MSLQWREQLSVGNDLIDDDHKYLIDTINQAEHSWKSKNRANLVAVWPPERTCRNLAGLEMLMEFGGHKGFIH